MGNDYYRLFSWKWQAVQPSLNNRNWALTHSFKKNDVLWRKAGSSVHNSDDHTSTFPWRQQSSIEQECCGHICFSVTQLITEKAFIRWDLMKRNVTASARSCLSKPGLSHFAWRFCKCPGWGTQPPTRLVGSDSSVCADSTGFTLIVNRQWRCQHPGKDRSGLGINMKIILTSRTSCSKLGAPRGPQTHFENCAPDWAYVDTDFVFFKPVY